MAEEQGDTQQANDVLLEVRNLTTSFTTDGTRVVAVDDVSFDVRRGETYGIVGESGSGKSVTALSILGLIADPPGKIEAGQVHFGGRDLRSLSLSELRAVRGNDIAMVFQEPMTSLNPVFTVGRQVAEPLRQHHKLSKADARKHAIEALASVGIPDAERRYGDYPHQFSGGMRQRVMIAMALVCRPSLLIADEPTTALDVTIQAQILDLMRKSKERLDGASIVLITHDLAVVAETCDRVMVMYGGRVQEIATAGDLFDRPLHPYTKGLLASIPRVENRDQPLTAIPGNVPALVDMPAGCKFCTRCADATDRCVSEEPALRAVEGRAVRCHLYDDAAETPASALEDQA